MPISSVSRVITFIGGGNMAEAFIGGLLGTGYPKDKLRVVEPVGDRRVYLKSKYPIAIHSTSKAALEGSEIILFAVKPQIMRDAAHDIASTIQTMDPKPVIVSIAAGILISDLSRWLGYSGEQASSLQVIRAMPNTPALMLCGATGLFANQYTGEKEKESVYEVMKAVNGQVHWVQKESLLDVVTALSGSGPAYFFYFMQHMIAASVDLGLSQDVARALIAQTCVGAGKMVLAGTDECATLRKKVTSPGGTTQAAVKVLGDLSIGNGVSKAVYAAWARSVELGVEFGKDPDAGSRKTKL